MTQQHDFKAALEAVEIGRLRKVDEDTIRFALRLADNIMQGPSDETAEIIASKCRCCGGIAEELYNAIREQAIKEIEG